MTKLMGTAAVLAATGCISLTAVAQDKAPVTWWYESANPEQQTALSSLLIEKFNATSETHNVSIIVAAMPSGRAGPWLTGMPTGRSPAPVFCGRVSSL